MGVLQTMWEHHQAGGRQAMPKWIRLSEFCTWLGIEAEDADSQSVDWLLSLRLPGGLILEGGHRRFPGAAMEDHVVQWQVGDDSEPCLQRGELFAGHGPSFFLAAVSGLVIAYELAMLRKRG